MNEEFGEAEVNMIRDILRMPGWELVLKMNRESIDQLRILATQEPNAISENKRTWYSGMAQGREDMLEDLNRIVAQKHDRE